MSSRFLGFMLAMLSFTVPAAAHARVPPVFYVWPFDGAPSVVRTFAPPPGPYAAGHRGVDLAGTVGELVRSAGPGVVAFAGRVAGRTLVSVEHPGGLRTTYEPITPTVVAGTVVAAGSPLGVLDAGHAGCPRPVPACLHWGLRRDDVYLDPLALLHRAQVRLLPLQPSAFGRPFARRS